MPERAGEDPRAEIVRAAEDLFDELIAHQRRRVVSLAREIIPEATPEDILNPQDAPALAADPRFNYEDGILAGILSARMALRARVFRSRGSRPVDSDGGEPGEGRR